VQTNSPLHVEVVRVGYCLDDEDPFPLLGDTYLVPETAGPQISILVLPIAGA
jgi:hypothetical protein